MKNNITKLTKKDLLRAVEVAKNGTPCTSLYRIEQKNGDVSHCVLGCVIEGIAKNRKKSYKSVFDTLAGTHCTLGMQQVENLITSSTGKDCFRIWAKNDSMGSDKKALKKWQIETLQSFADAAH